MVQYRSITANKRIFSNKSIGHLELVFIVFTRLDLESGYATEIKDSDQGSDGTFTQVLWLHILSEDIWRQSEATKASLTS